MEASASESIVPSKPPTAFVCHASEDKDRFVREFAKRLREKGVDAWLDEWEIQPGDRLVRKIFEGAIPAAEFFIVILSKDSVAKPWVREELDHALVRRIAECMTIIPIRLEGCNVPHSLRTTLWVEVPDPSNYDEALHRILNTIYRRDQRPPLGPPPFPFASESAPITGLSVNETLVLEAICELSIKNEYREGISIDALEERARQHSLDWPLLWDILQCLEHDGLIKNLRVLGSRPVIAVTVETAGFELYAQARIGGYPTLVKEIVALLLSEDASRLGLAFNQKLAVHIKRPILVVNHVLEVLEQEGLLKVSKANMNHWTVWRISPAMRRLLV